MSKYETDLGKDRANYEPLSPVPFLERAARIFPGKPAIVDGERVITYAEMARRCRQAADALRKAGIGKDDTVSVLSPNGVALIEMFRRTDPNRFAWRQPPYEYEHDKMPIDILAGSDVLRTQIESGVPIGEIAASWTEDEAAFARLRQPFLMY